MMACERLSSLSDFSEYVDSIGRVTGFNSTQLEDCRDVICSAIYGTGNPDISGIGVAVGYVVETALGFLLAALLFLKNTPLAMKRQMRRQSESRHGRIERVLISGVQSFFESAAYFAIALQIAIIVLVSRKDFGLSTSDFGAIEAQIGQAVSLISLLPLLYPAIYLNQEAQDESGSKTKDPRSNPRLFLFNLAVSLSFYPFISRNIHGFSLSPIGEGDSGEISKENWNSIEGLCFSDGLDSLRHNAVYSSLNGLEMAASLVIYITALWQQSELLTMHFYSSREEPLQDPPKPHLRQKSWAYRVLAFREKCKVWIGANPACGAILLLVPLALACPLLWVVFRLRSLQEELVRSIIGSEEYSGNDWGFGQVVSIVLFLPVVVDMVYCGLFDKAAAESRP